MRESVAGFVGQLRRCWRRPARRRTSSGGGSVAWIELTLERFDSTSFSETLETLESRALLSSAGSLDATFGVSGLAETAFNPYYYEVAGFTPLFEPMSVVMQSDGKFVIVGRASDGFYTVARYEPNGSVDLTFGVGGFVTTDFFGTREELKKVALQNDGKLVIGGRGAEYGSYVLSRFRTDGSLDTTFGSGGRVETFFESTDIGDYFSGFNSVAIQSDNKILAVGNFGANISLARYNEDGGLDTTFGNGGWITKESGGIAVGVALQGDSKIVVGSYGLLSRYDTNGSLDATFGNGGQVTTGSTAVATNVALQSDGKIVAAGREFVDEDPTTENGRHRGWLARYNTDGRLDTTFGSGGRITAESVTAVSLALQSDSKIVVAFSSGVLSRYNADGSLDATFGSGGQVTTSFGSNLSASSMVLQGDDKIVVGGSFDSDFYLARYNTAAIPNVVVTPEGGSTRIADTELPSPLFGGSTRSIVYTLADEPNHGQLRRNSTRLRVGSTFTQADVDAGRLSYRHDGSETTSDSFAYTVSGLHHQSLPRQTFPIFVTPVNDPPVLDGVSASTTFIENGRPQFFARSAHVTDPDSSNFSGSKLTFSISKDRTVADGYLDVASIGTGNGQVEVSGRSVRFTSGGVTREIGEFLPIGPSTDGLGDSLVATMVSAIHFNSLATRDAVQAVLRNIRFQDDSDNPSPLPRTVTITLTDGDGGTSNTLRTQIRVIPVDDRPRLDGFTSSLNAVAKEPARRLMPQATMLDPDLKRLDGATLVVRGSPTATIIPGDGVWRASASSTIRVDDRIVATVSHSGFQMSVRFNRNATSDDVTRVLRRVAVEASSTPGRRGTADVWFTDSNRVRSNVAHLTIESIAGTTAILTEVASRLSSQQITGVTVVTHGFQPTEDGDALHPLARAIWEREDASNGDDAAWFIDEDVNGPNGQYMFDTSPFDGQPVLPAIGTTNQRGEVVLLYDWAADSNNPGSGYGEANGQRLFQMLVDLGLVDPAQGAANSIPLHFIGHSFGAAVTSEAIERLAYYGVPVDQVTYLDPHDFDQPNIPVDGAQQLFTLGQPQFSDGSQGYGATVWNNVAFADVYYQTEGVVVPNGRPILGAYNELMNRRVGGSNPHSRVWDDFYLSTVIDVHGFSSDTTNFGGYAYSRISGGESQRPAPRFFDASQSHVYTSHHLVAFSASGSPIREANGSFRHGDQGSSGIIKHAPFWMPA